LTREGDNPITGSAFDWMVSNHAVWGWKAPVKASVSGVPFLSLLSLGTPDTQAILNYLKKLKLFWSIGKE